MGWPKETQYSVLQQNRRNRTPLPSYSVLAQTGGQLLTRKNTAQRVPANPNILCAYLQHRQFGEYKMVASPAVTDEVR
jgi:hypothetical protein